ncbi:MAG: LPS assembly lipoprotein LptE [Candidatus Scalindua sp.]|nr:LPS assembly lipoprotein LptE [Candidatus Scalindua sp.]MCR4344478.1 LPS assembly lipoprotein LptE [Candidatus Scalindua sp.]
MTKIEHQIIQTGLYKKISFSQLTCIIVLFAIISGCGYTTKSLISRKINSIFIPIFENDTFRSGLEFDLTTALKDEIMSNTKLRIATKDNADIILSGKIIRVDEGVHSSNAQDNIVESSVTITVEIKVYERRTGRGLTLESPTITNTAEFIVSRGENVKTATQESLEGLAKKIVYQLEEKW